MIGNIFGLAILFVFIGWILGSILFGSVISVILNKKLRELGSKNVGATNVLRTIGKKAAIVVLLFDFFKSWLATFLCLIAYKELMPLIVNNDNGLYKQCGVLIYLGGLFAVLGHCYPIQYFFVLFKTKFNFVEAKKHSGGKGVSSAAGLVAAISPWVFFITAFIFFTMVFVTKYVSLSSITATIGTTFLFLIPELDYFYMLNVLDAKILNIPPTLEAGKITEVINYYDTWWYIMSIVIVFVLISIVVTYRHKENIIRLINHNENKLGSKKNKSI